jgi:hypothetical protein
MKRLYYNGSNRQRRGESARVTGYEEIMLSLFKRLGRPDQITGELVISARSRLLTALREHLGWHTLFACHHTTASGLSEALYVCLGCGLRRPCSNARAASVYELLDGAGPVRLRVFYWVPLAPQEARDLQEMARLEALSQRWLVVGGVGVALTALSLFGPNPILLVAGALLALISINRGNQANLAWLTLVNKQITLLSAEIAAYRDQIEQWLVARAEAQAANRSDDPPEA